MPPKAKPKVYIVHEALKRDLSTGDMVPVQDFSSAEEFGELVHVFGQGAPKDYSDALSLIQERLSAYTQRDYLIFVGDPALIAMAAAVAVRATGGPVRWLTWERHEKRYRQNPALDFYSDAEETVPNG
jgi:hypothetical protein